MTDTDDTNKKTPTLWLTYAWKDNPTKDVDFVAQELESGGLLVKLDKWAIGAGKRLWAQIDRHICDPDECDAWAIYATENSLRSEPCLEELAYALDRAISNRGEYFPLIGIFPVTIGDPRDIPAAIRTRLYVNTTDPNWVERVVSAVEGRAPDIPREPVEPFEVSFHNPSGSTQHVIEVRPRTGTWAPFVAAIPIHEKDAVEPSILNGGRGSVPSAGITMGPAPHPSPDGKWWVMESQQPATSYMSYFIFCKQPPTQLVFGSKDKLHTIDIRTG